MKIYISTFLSLIISCNISHATDKVKLTARAPGSRHEDVIFKCEGNKKSRSVTVTWLVVNSRSKLSVDINSDTPADTENGIYSASFPNLPLDGKVYPIALKKGDVPPSYDISKRVTSTKDSLVIINGGEFQSFLSLASSDEIEYLNCTKLPIKSSTPIGFGPPSLR